MSDIEHCNWGGFPVVRGCQLETTTVEELKHISLQEEVVIARGNGRSYGDAGLGETMLHFNAQNINGFVDGVIDADAGISVGSLLNFLIPKGYILPVLPGHTMVSLGGAIASNIHGKNHHVDGSFSNFVVSLDLLTSSGEVITCSRQENTSIFMATFGAMGLTGIIVKASIQCLKIDSPYIETRTIKSSDLDSLISNFEKYADHQYSVAWLDLSYPRRQTLKAILSIGDHAKTNRPAKRSVDFSDLGHRLPIKSPMNLVTSVSKVFNYLYYKLNKEGDSLTDLQQFFFPLDSIQNWNTLYGPKGFFQYQMVVPESALISVFNSMDDLINQGKVVITLAVLKTMGDGNDRSPLSFPMKGYTLAIDLPNSPRSVKFIKKMNGLVIKAGGRVYLAKDAFLTSEELAQMYPGTKSFKNLLSGIDPDSKWQGYQSKRLNLK